jgi:NAD(P)-dependent dehydrogenase (short-subunit alcohol dehydrogenase family)
MHYPPIYGVKGSELAFRHQISGAASTMGIGRASAIAFAREGANVIVTDISANEKAGRALVDQINAESKSNGTDAEAIWAELDVSKEEQWNAAIKKAEAHFQASLDIAFLNAGILVEPGWEVKMEDHPTESYHKTIAVNQTGELSAATESFLLIRCRPLRGLLRLKSVGSKHGQKRSGIKRGGFDHPDRIGRRNLWDSWAICVFSHKSCGHLHDKMGGCGSRVERN